MKILLIIGASAMLVSCGTISKNKRSLSASIDSTVLRENADLIREQHEKIAYLENLVLESQLTGFTFDNTCDTGAVNALIKRIKSSGDSMTRRVADSLVQVLQQKDNSVRFYADGSAEARGALKTANYSKSVLQRQLTSWMDRFDSLAYEYEQLQKHVKVEVKEVEKIKRVVQFPWLLIVIAFAVGLVLGVKYSKQIKFFISKFKL